MSKYDIHLFETGWSVIDTATGQPVFEPKAHDVESARVMAIGAADVLNARDAELARLRAELARLAPLAEAAVRTAEALAEEFFDAMRRG